jgi:hypothetical protein
MSVFLYYRLFFAKLPVALAFFLLTPFSLYAENWRSVDPAHIALKSPTVEKEADAEAIFWEVRVKDELDGEIPRTVLTHHIRIKIFNDRGRESESTIDIPYLSNNKIKDIAGRTIKADGSIVELKKDSVFEREIVRASGIKIKAKSFAMPAVEPGAIIEYRWTEIRGDQLASYIRLELQRDIPVQLVTYYIKPYTASWFPYAMRLITFHGQNSPLQKEKDGFYSTTMTNVPAFRAEPNMPPEDEVRPWILVYYSEDKKLSPEKYWKEYGKEVYERYKPIMKVNDDIRKAATATIGDAATPEVKLERLVEFCRSKIKNVHDDASGLTADDLKKLKDNKSPADTLKRAYGSGLDIDLLFGALATAAGFEVRVAKVSDRSDTFFNPNFADSYFLSSYDIAVRVGDQWRFFDPAGSYLPIGMLRWQEEGQQALISDPKDPVFVPTPISPADKSLQKRTATLRLTEDGVLEGNVRVEYTGHFAVERKEYNDDDSETKREETLREDIKKQMASAELSDIRVENVTDSVKPFVYSYRIRIPGYAQRTGKRLFLKPAFFQYGVGTRFPTTERKHPVYFHFPWSSEDTVTIALPAGYELDNPDAPQSFAAGNVVKYDVGLQVTTDGRELHYRRAFIFNGLVFPLEKYAGVKQVFDAVHQLDNHAVTLKQTGIGAK